MLKNKNRISLMSFVIGILILMIQIVSPYIGELTSQEVIIEIPTWFTMLGIIFIALSVIPNLKIFKRYRENYIIKKSFLDITFIIIIILSSIVFFVGYTYGQYEKTTYIKSQNINTLNDQVNMLNSMKIVADNCSLNNKKIIIRNDDVGMYDSNKSLEWLTNLVYKKDIKITYGIVPFPASNNGPLLHYLNDLNKVNFELAIHGYDHEDLYGRTYEEQFNLIKNSTLIAEESLHFKPYTFIPPYNRGDINTTKICRILGYHTITDVRGYPLYLKSLKSSFNWDKAYNPPEHHNFEEFKEEFDSYENSSAQFFVICIHDWTFIGKDGELDPKKATDFEKAIDYMINKNVQFMTIEESYRWSVDRNSINYGLINETSYFADFRECKYNHTIRINPTPKNPQNITVYNVDTQKVVNYSKKYIKNIEFEAQPGYLYIIEYQS